MIHFQITEGGQRESFMLQKEVDWIDMLDPKGNVDLLALCYDRVCTEMVMKTSILLIILVFTEFPMQQEIVYPPEHFMRGNSPTHPSMSVGIIKASTFS